MSSYPMIYSFRDIAAGQDFVVGLAVRGWGVATQEASSWTFVGTQPHGIVGEGPSATLAHRKFLDLLRIQLYQLAEQSNGVNAFRQEVEKTMVPNPDAMALWAKALAEIRSNGAVPDTLRDLERKKAEENGPSIEVHVLTTQVEKDQQMKSTQAMNFARAA